MQNTVVLDWSDYRKVALQAAAEGCILLENKADTLPLGVGAKVAVFGRIQNHYYKSGTGSGGMVNACEIISIPEGLRANGISLCESLSETYRTWDAAHPVDPGLGWGREPWSQEEMPVTDELVHSAAAKSDVALVIIGRTAGEDKDQSITAGSYLLTPTEEDMIAKVREAFERMVVILNVGGLMDLHFIDRYRPEAVLLAWQGGMVGGQGVADVLCGKVNPSGHLTDTIAYEVADYPADPYFGDLTRNYYKEDIYVGYRYFETVAKERVRYPFGYGLSYTEFAEEIVECRAVGDGEPANVGCHMVGDGTAEEGNAGACEQDSVSVATWEIRVRVANVGKRAGRQVVFAFVEAPQGVLGKPARVLTGFAKTKTLAPGESEVVTLRIEPQDYVSFDDTGVTGHAAASVLEAGTYRIHVGTDVRHTQEVVAFTLSEIVVWEQFEKNSLAPVEGFERMVMSEDGPGFRYLEGTEPQEASCVAACQSVKNGEIGNALGENGGMQKFTLFDVEKGVCTLKQMVATLDNEELCCIVRGEGMGSAKVTPGTASAFAGISDKLKGRMLPAICCDDGPSGMRLDSGVQAFSLPIGTMLASTFDIKLVEKLYTYVSIEMVGNRVDILLGPGMNIHRHPLNGRNFEYFSEDPYVTGVMAEAMLRGLNAYGVCGCVKHFCGNNQEANRTGIDSVISARALREIYLKPFERAVKKVPYSAVMTTYGAVNGLWTAGSYELNTEILREQWGFDGIVMTDWWARINRRGEAPTTTDLATMIHAQNDLYMCCRDASYNSAGDNLEESLANGSLQRWELERSALNICRFALKIKAYERVKGIETNVVWEHKPKSPDEIDVANVPQIARTEEELRIDLSGTPSLQGTSYRYRADLREAGEYEVTLVGCSALSRVAQIPCTLFVDGKPIVTFSFRGTASEDVAIVQKVRFDNPEALLRLYVGRPGIELRSLCFRLQA